MERRGRTLAVTQHHSLEITRDGGRTWLSVRVRSLQFGRLRGDLSWVSFQSTDDTLTQFCGSLLGFRLAETMLFEGRIRPEVPSGFRIDVKQEEK